MKYTCQTLKAVRQSAIWSEWLKGIHLHDIKEHFLAQAVFLLEEFVFWIGACYVPANELLTGRSHLQEFWVLILDGHILGIAQQLPHYCAEVMRNSFSDEILWKKESIFFKIISLNIRSGLCFNRHNEIFLINVWWSSLLISEHGKQKM